SMVTEYDGERQDVQTYRLYPEDVGLRRAPLSEILGGDLATKVAITKAVLQGERGPKRDVVVLNAAAGLYAGGVVDSIAAGVPLAEESIDTGKALATFE